jgi:hypothetical protein
MLPRPVESGSAFLVGALMLLLGAVVVPRRLLALLVGLDRMAAGVEQVGRLAVQLLGLLVGRCRPFVRGSTTPSMLLLVGGVRHDHRP